jgi:hypothetical protein
LRYTPSSAVSESRARDRDGPSIDVVELGLEQGRIADRRCALVPSRGRNGSQCSLGVTLGVRTVRRIEKDLRERHSCLTAEALRVGLMEFTQLFVGGLDDARCVVDEEGELLREPPADNRIVLIEAQRLGLTREQLLLDEACHQSAQFLASWRTLPLVGKRFLQPVNLAVSDMDWIGRGRGCLGGVNQEVAGEQERAGDGEVQQGIFVKLHFSILAQAVEGIELLGTNCGCSKAGTDALSEDWLQQLQPWPDFHHWVRRLVATGPISGSSSYPPSSEERSLDAGLNLHAL